MRRTHIIGVDPGEITGIFDVRVRAEETEYESEVRCDTRSYEVPVHSVRPVLSVLACHDEYGTVYIGNELYVITQRTSRLTRQPAALEVTGVVRDVAKECGAVFNQYMKSEAAKLASDKVLRGIGWYQTSRDGHVNDAARQALLVLVDRDFRAFDKLMTLVR